MGHCSTISIVIFSLVLISSQSNAKSSKKPESFSFPIKKDDTTNQYYTSIQIGSNSTTLNVVIDLGGKLLYFNSINYSAASYRPVLCGTPQCSISSGGGCMFCVFSPPDTPCTNNTCSDYALNPFSGTRGYSPLGQDSLRVRPARGAAQRYYTVDNFPFQFSDPVLLHSLAAPAAGLIGLGRTEISLTAQIASAFMIREKFAICVPPGGGNGSLVVGERAYSGPSEGISKLLLTTPLVRNRVSTFGNDVIGNLTHEYFIDVKSVRVGSKTLSLNKTLLSINKKDGSGGTSIRTVRAYTGLHRSIYRALIDEFVMAAASHNIKRVASVAPFGACFNSKTVKSSKTGPNVPTIDLVLQNKNVYWRFYGANSMVRVSDEVVCLAFVEGEINIGGPTTSIVVGGYQMENYLLEFDVASSELRFSSSLLLHDTSCSKFGA